MKKLLLTTLGLATGLGAFAQVIVSTSPTNKNAVLEELTGKTCTFCPDGHKIAQQIKDANPGRVVLLNIHTGSYAAGTPNYRTTWGDYVGGLFSVSGYPTGAVNRTDYGSGVMHSRSMWSNNTTTTLGQSSPVNVGGDASIDLSTRQLSIDVEAYYTAAGSGSTNKMNVVILQNNIAGPQTGGATYNPAQMLPSGDYNHTHMVRHTLTPNAGDNIAAISATSLYTNTYNYTIPTQINNIPVELSDLEIAVYVSEGTSTGTILTGDYASINYILPPGAIAIDGSASEAHTLPADICTSSFTPEATFTNNSATNSTDTFEISYSLNGGAAVSVDILGTQTVVAGGTYTHTFNAITLPVGMNTISYSVSNGQSTTAFDMSMGNNTTTTFELPYIPATSVGSSYTWDFEGSADGTETWSNAINTTNSDFFVINQSMFTGINNAIGGYAASANSFRHRLYNMSNGQANDFVTHKFDLSATTSPELKFDYAYGQLSAGSNDGLEIYVSTDCGSIWTQIFNQSGNSFTTGPASSSATFYPTSSQWGTETINLNAYKQNDVMFKFSVVAGNAGNCFYLDNILVDETTGINSIETQNSFQVFPNPTQDVATISFDLAKTASVNMEVYNSIGRLVFSNGSKAMEIGHQKMVFDGSELPNGIYFINLTIDDKLITKKVSLVK